MQFGQPFDITPTPIADLVVVQLCVHGDARGWFKENWQRHTYTQHPAAPQALRDFRPIQNNISFNAQRGVTRGLHAEPWDKLVSVASGKVFGAWCDLRADSSTYGRTFSIEITPDTAVFVPRGVANGFQALSDDTAYAYLVNAHWSAQATYLNVNAADPALAIDWPIALTDPSCIRSEKDVHHPPLAAIAPLPPAPMLILGAQGQVGQALQAQFPQATALSAAECDLTADLAALEAAVDWSQFAVVCNAAAYTLVDAAEDAVASAWRVNATAVQNLAILAQRHDFCLVHFSTDYVFDGTATSYNETAPVCPLNVYGQSKAAGDLAACSAPRHYVLRTSWVVGAGSNFVRTMHQLALRDQPVMVIDDQIGRLSFASELARAVAHLLDGQHPYGLYNCTSTGEASSWFDVARQVYTAQGKADLVTAVDTATYGADKQLAARPACSVLELEKIQHTGFTPGAWPTLLDEYLRNLAATNGAG